MKLIDLDSCYVENDKIICDLKKPKFQQNGEHIIAGRSNIASSDDNFMVEAAPYADGAVGISLPTFPGGPYINFDVGASFPWTIFPIPTKVVDRIGQAWIPSPIKGGPEDEFQGLPRLKVEKPDEFIKNITIEKE